MSDSATSLDEIDSTAIADPSTFTTDDLTTKGAVFVVPVDAPLPSELGALEVPSGSLYERLRSLCSPDDGAFSFVPVSGAELLHLERPWRLLQVAKRVYVLFELPGARYDVMFTQASRQIGLRRVEWPSVAEGIASKAVADQRTKDVAPWQLRQDLSAPGRRLPKVARAGAEELPIPTADDGDEDR